MQNEPELFLSPSLYHAEVMKNLKPSHAYAGGDVRAWQETLRAKLAELVGVWPIDTTPADMRARWAEEHPGQAIAAPRPPLNPRTSWRRETDLGTIEKIAFTSEPFADVLTYLCIPAGLKPPYPLMICLQGHSTGMHVSIGVQRDDETQPYQAEGDRDFALGCMRRGVAALCIEQRSFGYRREQVQERVGEHGCHDATMQALLIGRTLVGERTYDVDRAIDYLESRGDVNMAKLGVMGNSGGGTVTILSAALLPRIQFAIPSCGFASYRGSIGSMYHCADNYIPGILRYAEMGDVMSLFAPKPLVIVAGVEDKIFPIAAVKESYAQVERVYAESGAAGKCHLVVGSEGHRFYADLAWEKMTPYILG